MKAQNTKGQSQGTGFSIDLNLDCPNDCEAFIDTHGTIKGKSLAWRLGFKGKGATKAADALSNYAWNKHTAMLLRTAGNIAEAVRYEIICDNIYTQDIRPHITCW